MKQIGWMVVALAIPMSACIESTRGGGATDTSVDTDVTDTVVGSCLDDCDDNNHCTDDHCNASNVCVYTVNPECRPECTRRDATTIDAMTGGPFKLLATVTEDFQQTCAEGCACSDVLLVDRFDAEASVRDDSDIWKCVSVGCDDVPRCRPAYYNTRYLFWGTTEPGILGDEALPIGPRELDIDGFCLPTTPAGLDGFYEGSLTLGTLTFPADLNVLSIDEGEFVDVSLGLTVTDQDGQSSYLTIPAEDVELLDGEFRVTVDVFELGGGSKVFRLFPIRNELHGFIEGDINGQRGQLGLKRAEFEDFPEPF